MVRDGRRPTKENTDKKTIIAPLDRNKLM